MIKVFKWLHQPESWDGNFQSNRLEGAKNEKNIVLGCINSNMDNNIHKLDLKDIMYIKAVDKTL